jgi:Flp pilus assembly protein TadD
LAKEATTNPYLHEMQPYALAEAGRLDAAMAEFRQSIVLDPRCVTVHINLGNSLQAKGKLDAAMDEYRKAIALDPKDAQAHGSSGLDLLQQGSYAAARESTMRALVLLAEILAV